jgi:hypothetical protein
MSTTTTTKRKTACKTAGNSEAQPVKRLSKAGEFMRKYPHGIGKILDHKAVLK